MAKVLYKRGGYLSTRRLAFETVEWLSDLSDAMGQRIAALAPEHQQILMLAACLGDTFAPSLLEQLCQQDRAAVDAAIVAGIEHGVLMPADHQLRFAHTRLRHALTARLNPAARAIVHWRIAHLLERLHADHLERHVLEIASHIVAAGDLADPQVAVTYMRQAGDQALAMFAWSEAAQYYEHALRAADAIDGFPAQASAALHDQAALAHRRHRDVGPALGHVDDALAIYRALNDRRGLAQTLIWQIQLRDTHAPIPPGVLPSVVEPLHDALNALGEDEPSLRGHILTVLSQAYRHAREPEQAKAMAQRALAIGDHLHDDRLHCRASEAFGLASLSQLHVEAAIANWQLARDAAEQTGDLVLYSRPLMNLALALHLQGNLEEAEATALEGADVISNIQDWGAYSNMFSHLASLAVTKGDFRATERHVRDALRMAARARYPWSGFRALQARACASTWRGLWDDAAQALDNMIEPNDLFASPGDFESLVVRVFRQLVLAYQSGLLTERLRPLAAEFMAVARYDTDSLAPLCALVELGLQTFNPQLAAHPVEMLAAALEEDILFTRDWCFLIPRILGLEAMLREQWEEAADHFTHAIKAALQANARPELARTCFDFVRLTYLCDGFYNEQVLPILEQAKTIFSELEMLPYAQLAFKVQEHVFSSIQQPPETDTDATDAKRFPEPPSRNGSTAIE